MLKPLRMQKATVGVHKAYLDDVVAALHEAGIMEIRSIWDHEPDATGSLGEAERSPFYERCIANIRKIDAIIDALPAQRDEEPQAFSRFLFPEPPERIPVKKRSIRELCRDADHLIAQTDDARELRRETGAVDDRIATLHALRSSVASLSALDPDLSYLGESVFLYSVAALIDAGDAPVLDEIGRRFPDDAIHIETVPRENRFPVVITTLRGYREELDRLLKESGIRVLEMPALRGRPPEVIAGLDAEIESLAMDGNVLRTRLDELGERFSLPLRMLQEELAIEKERMLSRANFGSTLDTVFIEGWVAEKDTGRLQSICEEASRDHAFCISADPGDGEDDVPIEYNNPSWLRPFEMITTMFSRPHYGEIDPTVFTGPLLIAFFALMLGDAVYGMAIILLGLLLYAGIGRVSESVRNAGVILAVAGGATVVSGVLQGSYLGDFLPRFLGIQPPVLMNPLESPVAFLRIALIIGILQINLGLVLAAFQNFRSGQFRSMLHEQIAWFLIQPAAAVVIYTLFGWAAFPPGATAVVYAAGVVGILLLFTRHGALGFFNLTGFLGDWLSYARLLALALATGGIAMTVNILAQMVAGDHLYQMLLAFLILVIGHSFNFILQSLGAFIHSLRLQFVEFFGKFYVGGGKAFAPFSAKRDMTVLVGGEW